MERKIHINAGDRKPFRKQDHHAETTREQVLSPYRTMPLRLRETSRSAQRWVPLTRLAISLLALTICLIGLEVAMLSDPRRNAHRPAPTATAVRKTPTPPPVTVVVVPAMDTSSTSSQDTVLTPTAAPVITVPTLEIEPTSAPVEQPPEQTQPVMVPTLPPMTPDPEPVPTQAPTVQPTPQSDPTTVPTPASSPVASPSLTN